MSVSVLLHGQLSPEDLQELCAWYKIRDTLFGDNDVLQCIEKALVLASSCEHPNAVCLTKLFAGRDVLSREESRQSFLGCENDRELFALLVCLFAILMRCAELLILAMRLPKRG
jgi:hypothetical protein